MWRCSGDVWRAEDVRNRRRQEQMTTIIENSRQKNKQTEQAVQLVVLSTQCAPAPCKWWLDRHPERSSWRSPRVSVMRVIILHLWTKSEVRIGLPSRRYGWFSVSRPRDLDLDLDLDLSISKWGHRSPGSLASFLSTLSLILMSSVLDIESGTGQTDRQTDKQTDRQADRQVDRQIERRTDRQTDGRTERHTDRHQCTDCAPPYWRGGRPDITTQRKTENKKIKQLCCMSHSSTDRPDWVGSCRWRRRSSHSCPVWRSPAASLMTSLMTSRCCESAEPGVQLAV